jgi:hypothetical protein
MKRVEKYKLHVLKGISLNMKIHLQNNVLHYQQWPTRGLHATLYNTLLQTSGAFCLHVQSFLTHTYIVVDGFWFPTHSVSNTLCHGDTLHLVVGWKSDKLLAFHSLLFGFQMSDRIGDTYSNLFPYLNVHQCHTIDRLIDW